MLKCRKFIFPAIKVIQTSPIRSNPYIALLVFQKASYDVIVDALKIVGLIKMVKPEFVLVDNIDTLQVRTHP